jgi:hypothetical protein
MFTEPATGFYPEPHYSSPSLTAAEVKNMWVFSSTISLSFHDVELNEVWKI